MRSIVVFPAFRTTASEEVLRDVFVYVNDSRTRREINKIVAAKLTDEPTVVVGHSLGSVVSYEVLREHAGNSVPQLITIGSPLGIRAIRNQLKTPLTMPAGVEDWYNAYDDRDVVASLPAQCREFQYQAADQELSVCKQPHREPARHRRVSR